MSKNKNARIVEDRNGATLVSYATPVAFLDKLTGDLYVTEEHFSVTTSKHINLWLRQLPGNTVANKKKIPQDQLEAKANFVSVATL